jgi:hypothetical protein
LSCLSRGNIVEKGKGNGSVERCIAVTLLR